MMDEDHYIQFLERYIQNLHTHEEYDGFMDWYNTISPDEAFEVIEAYARICEKYNLANQLFPGSNRLVDDIEKRLDALEAASPEEIETDNPVGWNIWKFVAAAMIILAGTGAFYFFGHREIAPAETARVKKITTDIAPGSNKAILTLGDGTVVVLDSARNGRIAWQSGIHITKAADGKLIYKITDPAIKNGHPSPEIYNTITTPKGGQYEVSLPDGTRVWLNSLSSVRFPATFNDRYRKVEITGEVYFEVTKDAKHPFKVKINNHMEIEVLGTHFNVNSYADENSINTTLLEGSVLVNAYQKVKMLAPGQQAQVRAGGGAIKLVKHADVMDAVAWKNGAFSFADADLSTVMRQLARWYNVEVKFEGAVPSGHFNGKISRGLTLVQVLKVLTLTRVKYRIEDGNKIIIISD